jgi:hypothetical protein
VSASNGDDGSGSTGTGGESSPDGTILDGGATGTTSGTTGVTPGGTAGGSAGSGGSTGSTSGTSGPGLTGGRKAKPIVVGVTYPDLAAIAAAFGKQDEAKEADPKTWITRIIDYVNKTGGIAGRPLKAVWYKADTAADSSTSGQQACATFTQDNKVDFVINTGVGGDTLPACLLSAKVSMMGGPFAQADTVDMRRLPNAFNPNAIRLDRLFSAMVTLSLNRGLIKKGDKLGVLIEDCPWGHRIYDNTLTPLAKRLGITLQKGSVRCITNIVSDLGPVTSDIQRATLQFATNHVSHVIAVSAAEAFLIAQFTKNASQQKYFPKYFISSTAYPFNDSRKNGTVTYSPDAEPNMTGYGFNPLLDVGPLTRPDTPGQKTVQATCLKADPKEGIYAKSKGQDGYYFSVGVIRGYCDAFFVLKAVLEANGVQFSLGAFNAAYQSLLNGKLSSTLNGGGFFRVPKDGTDAIGLLKPFAWDAKRGQFVYTGAAVPVP